VPLKPLVPLVRYLLVPVCRLAPANRHTHRHTQDKYCNPLAHVHQVLKFASLLVSNTTANCTITYTYPLLQSAYPITKYMYTPLSQFKAHTLSQSVHLIPLFQSAHPVTKTCPITKYTPITNCIPVLATITYIWITNLKDFIWSLHLEPFWYQRRL